MKKCLSVIVIILILPFTLFASVNETLPSFHWAYDYIDALRIRQCFDDLYAMNRPYTRGEVARSLIETGKQIKENKLNLSGSEMKQFDRLVNEFETEIQAIQGKAEEADVLNLGLRLQGDIDKTSESKADYRGVYRTKINLPLGKYVTLYNGMSIDKYKAEDPLYAGKKWMDNAAFAEQAYASFHAARFRFKFGRDFLRWGAGSQGTLIFSDVARPMDQFLGSVQSGPFRFSFFTSVLDELPFSQALADSLGFRFSRRYVSAHRLDGRFFNGKLQCAVTEAVIYGGESRNIEWYFLNPLMFYYSAQANKSGLGNVFGSVDVLVYPLPKWELYGSLLIDDIQVEKKVVGDLEPNEIGTLIGTRWADPFQVPGLTLSGEYVRVTNRTYKTPNIWETFIHRNEPLGHPLGNDFDQWQIECSQWIGGDFLIKAGYGVTRKGEGSLYTPWDEPWMNSTLDEGYSEPFPTGIVEKSSTLSLSLKYYPSTYWGIQGEFHSSQIENAGNVEGQKENAVSWRIGVWVEGDVFWKLK